MTNNVKGFTKIDVGHSYLVLIQEIQRPVIKWLKQIGTGRPTSSIYTMLWWMENANDSKMVTCFVCNYTFKYFASNTTCNRYRSVIMSCRTQKCYEMRFKCGSLEDAIFFIANLFRVRIWPCTELLRGKFFASMNFDRNENRWRVNDELLYLT